MKSGTILMYNCSGPEFSKLRQIFAMLRLRMRVVAPDRYHVTLEELAEGKGEASEQENAIRLARSLASPNVLDYIELSHDYGIIEVPTPKGWLGSSLRKLNVRAKLGVNIIAVERDGKVEVTLDPDRELSDGDVLVVLGDNKALERVQRQWRSNGLLPGKIPCCSRHGAS